MTKKEIDISKIVGKNYEEFWNFKGRYRVVKGGRGSKKSHTTALWMIYHILKYKTANILCVRQFYNSLKDSCFSELKKAASRLNVLHLFDFKISPLEITVKATGQKILFRGFDNPDSITSITCSNGHLCWIWIEEAYQVQSEDEFNKLDFSIRGITDKELFPQITLTLNPWSEMWIKNRFFDVRKNKNVLAMTRNYYHNEFLSKEDKKMFLELKKNDKRAYQIVGEGQWGIAKGNYFSEFSYDLHTIEPISLEKENYSFYASFDYGLDMFACYFYAVDRFMRVFVIKEIYEKNLIISKAAKLLKEESMEFDLKAIYAPPDMWSRQRETGKSIADIFAQNDCPLIKASNNRVGGWLSLKEKLKPYYENGVITSSLKIFRNCNNLISSIPKLMTDTKNPSDVSNFPHEITHGPDALRYFLGSCFNIENGIKPIKKNEFKQEISEELTDFDISEFISF